MNQAGYSDKALEQMAQDFEKENGGKVQVKFTFVKYDELHDKIVASAAASTATYDVVLLDLIWTSEFGDKGYVEALDPNLADIKKDDIAPAVWKAFTYQGKIWAFPFLANFQNFFYNKDQLAKAGFNAPPKTMDEWVAQMEALKAKGIVQYPYTDSWRQAEGLVCDYVRTAGEFGGSLFDDKGQPVMDQGAGLQALKFMRMLVDKGLANPNALNSDEPTAKDAFISGQAAFNTNWTFVYGQMNDASVSKVKGAAEIGTMPVAGGVNLPSASVSGFQGLAIMANSAHKKEAWQWIKYATSPAVQAKHLEEMPVWTSVQKSPEAKKVNPAIDIMAINLANVFNRPQVPDYQQVSAVIQEEVHKTLLKQETPEQAAKNMVDRIKKLGK